MIKYVVFGRADEVVAVLDTEAEAISERDKELGRIVYLRDDGDPAVRAFLAKRPTTRGG